jgi:biopolymer transport protein ExbD
MSKFKKGAKRGMPAISTASLPDIVFILLFFFMVATVIRSDDEKVKIERPEASSARQPKFKIGSRRNA